MNDDAKFCRNLGPEFSLVQEPWIPVNVVGETQPKMVGLKEFYLNCDSFSAVAEGNPLIRASLLRFLISFTYLVVGEQFSYSKAKTSKGLKEIKNFDEKSIDSVLERWNERLWLFHPEYPFFQDIRLADDTSLNKPVGSLVISPFLPGKSSARWGINMDAVEYASIDEVARLLCVAWFYTPTGNASRRYDPNSDEASKRVASVAAANFPTLTNFFRVGSTVFETLISNLLKDHLPSEESECPAYLRIENLQTVSEQLHPLYSSTLSAFTPLIVDSEPNQEKFGNNFLCGSTILDDNYSDVAKRFTELSLSDDPFVIYKQNPENKPNHPRANIQGSLVSLPKFCLELHRSFNDKDISSSGVFKPKDLLVSESNVVNQFDVFQIIQGGNSNSRLISGVESSRVTAESLSIYSLPLSEEDAQQRGEIIVSQLDLLLASKKSAISYLRSSVAKAFDSDGKGLSEAARDKITNDLMDSVGMSVSKLIQQVSRSQVSDESLKTVRQDWMNLVMNIFDRHTNALKFSQTSANTYWNARSFLQNNLRKVLML